jgi:CRISPR-associated endonuclease Cas1
MAATKTVYQLSQSYNSLAPRHGVITLCGYGIQVRVDRAHLVLEDGIGADRGRGRFPRVGHGLRRLVVVGADGMVSLAALRWLADQKVAFAMLDRDGSVLATTGPVHASDAKLRRAQALARQCEVALKIAKVLIEAKLSGQEALVRHKLIDLPKADVIARFRERLSAAETLDAVRNLEAQAAASYWTAWSTLPITFPRTDLKRVPDHWRTFGTRKSPLTGSPRLAVSPPGAILNYCYALLQSETRLATSAIGLDPGIGMLHVDAPNRDSLACDIMEAVRPAVDAWLLDWIIREPLRRSDFFEERNGNCRLMGAFAAKLSETAPIWGKLVAPWAEYVAGTLWATASHSKTGGLISTRLTQQHRREAKGRPPLPAVKMPTPDSVCRGCGKQIQKGRSNCLTCAVTTNRANFDAGRKTAQSPESLKKRSATQRQHKDAIQTWKPSDLPSWLTRDTYVTRIQPALASVPKSRIRSALGVSEPYSSHIRAGKRTPHPRHWRVLALLAGVLSHSG